METRILKNKFIGAMVGSALGDAIGELAFYYPEKRSLLEAVSRASQLRYTDDTAMAMGMAQSMNPCPLPSMPS
ncbi:MAG: ADP-ribosylglycohydrolase family protein [Deltaproteobacteria bacterium]|nr:ADP-ribosylglycohydrolase family protein [Deltaproteobacteria bacterium]